MSKIYCKLPSYHQQRIQRRRALKYMRRTAKACRNDAHMRLVSSHQSHSKCWWKRIYTIMITLLALALIIVIAAKILRTTNLGTNAIHMFNYF